MPTTTRRATPDDAPALTELRALMLSAMGRDVGGPDAPWRASARAWFAAQLAQVGACAAFVVADDDGVVLACAVGTCDRRAPGPGDLGGWAGHLFNVSTHPDHRRAGHARRCVEALLDWYSRETAVRVVGLSATDDAAELYRSLGFTERAHPSLRLVLERR